MTKIMPQNKQQLRYQWIKPVLEKYISIEQLLSVCPFSKRTIQYWLSRYKQYGIEGLTDKSMIPHHQPDKTPEWMIDRILAIKEDMKIGGKKIMWELQKEHIGIAEPTVNRILKQHGKTRRYRKRREYILKRTPIKQPGELVEIDIKYGVHFGFGKWWYQYTAIDLASRWRLLRGYENRENNYSIRFLEELQESTRHLFTIKAIKTDNDPVFTNRITGYSKSTDPYNPRLHDLDIWCQDNNIIHYLIDPGKPTQNGHVERSHRSDKDYFYTHLQEPQTIEEYNYKLRLWNNWYNDLQHCALDGLSPNDYLRKVQKVVI